MEDALSAQLVAGDVSNQLGWNKERERESEKDEKNPNVEYGIRVPFSFCFPLVGCISPKYDEPPLVRLFVALDSIEI